MTQTAHTIGMSWADRVWLEMSSSVILGPLELPDLDALRAAFVRLAGLGAQTRMGDSISDDRAHWRYDPASLLALATEAVIEIPAPQIAADTPEADVLAVANRLMEQAQQLRGPAAVRVVRAGNFVIYDQNHAIGDARPLLDNLSALIRVAAGLVKPGGHLVYIVCSLLDEEGAGQIDGFLHDYPGWMADGLAPVAGRPHRAGYRLTPAVERTDGFFVARLKRP